MPLYLGFASKNALTLWLLAMLECIYYSPGRTFDVSYFVINPIVMYRKFYFALLCLLMSGSAALSAQGVFFSEDFGDGAIPSGWANTVILGDNTPSARWVYSTQGPQGPFATDPIASTTAANGFVMFDSDVNCSGEQDAWLITPSINASTKTEVYLQFQTFYRSFNDRPQIRVGTNLNNLSTWATFEVFPGITANAFGGAIEGNQALNPQLITLDISEFAAGQATVYVAFQFLSTTDTPNGGNAPGCAYAWQVDDMILTDINPRPDNDMRVNAFFAVAPNAVTPASQVEPIGFLADIANVGNLDQPSSKLKLTITNGLDEVVFQDSLTYGLITSDSTAENVLFENEFLPDAVEDVYTGVYEISFATEDEVPGNNEQSFVFVVSDTLYAKEIRATRGVAPAASSSYTYGNVFYVGDAAGQFARYIGFGVTNAEDLVDQDVTVFLYEWEGDTNGDFIANTDEMELLGFNSYTFTGEEGDELIWLSANEDSGVELQNDRYYIPAVQYQDINTVDFFLQASEDFDYAGMNFYTDSLERPRYGAALNVGNDDDELSLIGFGLDIVPVVRMSIGPDIAVGTQNPVLPAEAVTLYPNPVRDEAVLAFQLAAVSSEATITVYNNLAQLVQTRQLENVQNDHVRLNTKELPNGSYLVRIETEAGSRTIKMNVQH